MKVYETMTLYRLFSVLPKLKKKNASRNLIRDFSRANDVSILDDLQHALICSVIHPEIRNPFGLG